MPILHRKEFKIQVKLDNRISKMVNNLGKNIFTRTSSAMRGVESEVARSMPLAIILIPKFLPSNVLAQILLVM